VAYDGAVTPVVRPVALHRRRSGAAQLFPTILAAQGGGWPTSTLGLAVEAIGDGCSGPAREGTRTEPGHHQGFWPDLAMAEPSISLGLSDGW
jgi:hypothetical protein